MQTFAANIIQYLRQLNFDGLVLDWENPVTRPPSVPEDKHRFTQLLQTLMEAFEKEATENSKPRLLLASTLKPSTWQISQSYELPDIANYVDWLDLTAFDLHGTWEGGVEHHSPLYSVTFDDKDSIHYMIQRIINMSVPRDKLDLGIPLYGVTFNLSDPTNYDTGAPIVGSGAAGELSHQSGRLAWFEICKLISNDSFTSGRLSDTKAPFVVDGSRYTGYDDTQSIQEKVDYVMENQLGGVSIFTIDMDDFNGLCGGERNPLLHTVQRQFSGLVG
nr:hypothetical protein BaRGS_013414 [Batillaria attramentaria]